MQTGIGLLNMEARQLWFDIMASVLYNHELQYKQRKVDFKGE